MIKGRGEDYGDEWERGVMREEGVVGVIVVGILVG